jgi:phytoene dehydrogenase-like protein
MVQSFNSDRREVLKSLLAAIPVAGLDWGSFPTGSAHADPDQFDAVIIGAGLGGLSCAAAFARQGFKPLVIEQHDKPGGYATAFKRPGGFLFDVSLHSTTVGERNGVRNLIPGFPEIKEIEFVPHKVLYRAIFPQHDIRVPAKSLPAYIETLTKAFPAEAQGIQGLFDEMTALAQEIRRYSPGKTDMSRMPIDFPHLVRYSASTWGQVVDARIKDPKLKGIVSALWGYFGLPPSRLASIYYALPTISYIVEGGYYPRGRSQTISDAFVKFIEERGGKVLLRTRVERILAENGAASGVRTADNRDYKARVVVSNANAYDTFHKLLEPSDLLRDYLARMDRFSVSLSAFQVFLGLKTDLVRRLGITDTEVFYSPGYDGDAGYKAAVQGDMGNPGFGLALYDNLFEGYSPKGKNTINLLALQGFDHWKPYEADYWKGNKAAYRAEKERIANILIRQAEKVLLPGLSKAIEVKDIGTPLTNARYTGNYRGAIYGWDQTLDNAMPRRVGQTTPIKNLYLAGAWTSPGHGYSAVIQSGLQCFSLIMAGWDKPARPA